MKAFHIPERDNAPWTRIGAALIDEAASGQDTEEIALVPTGAYPSVPRVGRLTSWSSAYTLLRNVVRSARAALNKPEQYLWLTPASRDD